MSRRTVTRRSVPRRSVARTRAASTPRSDIIAAAATAMARHGYHGMSMRDLARATGKAPASFYSHFASKEAVLLAIQEGAFLELLASADAALGGAGGPKARLYAFILNHVTYVAEHPDVMRVLVNEAATLPRPERDIVRRLKERYYALGRSLVEANFVADRIEIERTTYAIFGMLNWAYGWYSEERHGSPSDVARTIRRLVLGGLSLAVSDERAEAS